MKSFLSKMEKKFGRYAIPHLTRYIILTYIIGYILVALQNGGVSILDYLYLHPGLIARGQIWRIVSWVLMPPSSFSIWTVVMLFCYYQLGTVLEQAWGDFLYNVYIFFGVIMTIVGACIAYAILGPSGYMIYGVSMISTYYISLSIFLGFAMTFPDQQLLLFFIIPIKIKYLAILDVVYLVYSIVQSGFNPAITVMIVCSLASTIIFFFATRNYSRFNPQRRRQQKQFREAFSGWQTYAGQGGTSGGQARRASQGAHQIARHKCAICGRTEITNPELEFRFCSKCNGNYEYCNDHLFSHTHIE